MTTRDYLKVFTRRWRILALFAILGIAGAVVTTVVTPATYRADTSLFVSTDATSDQTQANSGNSFAQSRVKSYVAIVTAPDVLDATERDLNLGLSQTALKDKLTATAASDSLIITISATDADPATAAAIANATGRAFADVVQRFETPTGTTQSTVKVLVTDPALAPTAPVTPNGLLNVLLGLLVGLILGVAAAGLREVLDTAVRAPEELAEAAGVPLLGTIAADAQTTRQPVAAKVNARGPRAEGFRQLRTNLQFVDVDHPPRVISVNSAVPGEGKTSTAVNVAAALAEGGHRVCLIDADLRRPMVAELLGLVGTVGLTNVLIGQLPLSEAYQYVGTSLRVITSGPLPPNPSELLATNHAHELIRQVAADVDFVIIDTAPLLPVADGAEIAAAADGSILVSRWGHTSFAQVRRSVEALDRVDARLLGVVLNRVPSRHASSYGYTYYGRRANEAGHRREGGRTVTPELETTVEESALTPAQVAAPVVERGAPETADAVPAVATSTPDEPVVAVTASDVPPATVVPAAEPEAEAAAPDVAVAAEPVANGPEAEAAAPDVAAADEPATKEPVANEPVPDEPVADAPAADEPVADEPVHAGTTDTAPATPAAPATGPILTTISVRRSTPVRRPRSAPRTTATKPAAAAAADGAGAGPGSTVVTASPTSGATGEVLELDRRRSRVS